MNLDQRLRPTAAFPFLAVLLVASAAAQTPPLGWIAREINHGGRSALAYDSVRERSVMFRGSHGIDPGQCAVWEWDGLLWSHRAEQPAPAPRFGHAMVFDTARNELMVCGGQDTPFETWTSNGTTWLLRTSAIAPAPLALHGLAYDGARQRVVLFGGQAQPSGLAQSATWEWNGFSWTLQQPATSPPALYLPAMTWDAVRQRVVLFGGYDQQQRPQADTWEWDGTTWSRRTPATGPRSGRVMAFDGARQRTVLLTDNLGYTGQTWEWDGTSWLQRTPAQSPDPFKTGAMAYDARRQRVVAVYFVYHDQVEADTWEWDGTNWLQRTARPHASGGHALAADLVRQRVVLFGGGDDNGQQLQQDTWEWDGQDWLRRTPAVSPQARMGHALAFDLVRGRTVLFGGFGTSLPAADTWEWDGINWLQAFPANSPTLRIGAAMAYDLARQRVVLFGGRIGVQAQADTWEWNGANWTQRTPLTSPTGRSDHAMTYDPARQRVVLFGGWGSATSAGLSDTWEWDGVNWTRRLPTISPPGRGGHGMTYDAARGRVVLFGGSADRISQDLSDTWEWDGNSWTWTTPATAPCARTGTALAWDAARQRVLLFGGMYFGRTLCDTWHYGPIRRATTQAVGTACAGVAPWPVLSTNEPYLGNGAFTLDVLSGRASSAYLLGLARTAQALPIGGNCTLYLAAPMFVLFGATNSSGFGTILLPVPLDQSLRGGSLYAQAFVVDAQSPIGLVTTGARKLTFGD